MPVFKDEKRGTWYVMARYCDWTGTRRQKCKRGFPSKRDAQDWEHGFKLQTCSDLDMTFEAFVELYTKDKMLTPCLIDGAADGLSCRADEL